MRQRIYSSVAWVLLLVSCGTALEDNKRNIYHVEVRDDNDTPLDNIEINVAIFRGMTNAGTEFPLRSFLGFVGADITDSQGQATVLSLSLGPNNTRSLPYVVINGDDQVSGFFIDNTTFLNPEYGSIAYEIGRTESNEVFLPMTTLKKRATLQLEISNTSETSDTLIYTLDYEKDVQLFQLGTEQQDVLDQMQGDVQSAGEVVQAQVPTLRNTTAMFTYILRNNGDSTPISIEIPITQENQVYEFSF